MQANAVEQAWIGLAHVKPVGDGPILGATDPGAYVQVVCWASTFGDFMALVKRELQDDSLELEELKDAEPVADRLSHGYVDEQLQELVNRVGPAEPILFATFHIYESE